MGFIDAQRGECSSLEAGFCEQGNELLLFMKDMNILNS
jgi:hypothetical protein